MVTLRGIQTTTGLSVVFWGYMSSASSGAQSYERFFDLSGITTAGNCNFDPPFYHVRNGLSSSTYYNFGYTFSSDLNGNWRHYTLSIDTLGNWYVWIDGSAKVCPSGCGSTGTGGIPAQVSSTSTYYYYIGAAVPTCGNSYLDGGIDDFRIYPNILTTAQVLELYSGKVEVYAQNASSIPVSCTATCAGSFVRCLQSGMGICCGAGQYFIEGVSTACQTCAVGTYGTGSATSCTSCQANTYSVSGATACTACPTNSWSAAGAGSCTANVGYYNLGSSLTAYYPFNSNNILADSTGNLGSLTGTAGSTMPTSNTATVPYAGGQSIYFNSSNSQILSFPTFALPDPYSVYFWWYLSSIPSSSSSGPAAFSFGSGASDWVIFYHNGYGETFYRFREMSNSAFLGDVETPASDVVKQSWVHYCVSWEGQIGNIWKNGLPEVVNAAHSGGTAANRRIISYITNYLGAADPSSVGNYMNGYMDEFMIFN